MSEQPNAPSTTTKGDALVIERVFDAPVETVWKAWTEAESIKKWHGPAGFTAPTIEQDFRVGGKFLYAMTNPDWDNGRVYWSTGVFQEIDPLKKIVATDSFADENGNVVPASHYGMPADLPLEMKTTVMFEDLGGKTKLTLIHEGLGEMAEGANEGWSTSLDKLEQLVTKAA